MDEQLRFGCLWLEKWAPTLYICLPPLFYFSHLHSASPATVTKLRARKVSFQLLQTTNSRLKFKQRAQVPRAPCAHGWPAPAPNNLKLASRPNTYFLSAEFKLKYSHLGRKESKAKKSSFLSSVYCIQYTYILTWASVKPFSLHLSIPEHVSRNLNI